MKINVLFFAVVLAGAGILSCNKVDKVSAPKTEKKGITIPSIGRKGTVGGTVKGWRQYTKRDDSLMMLDANLVLHGIARKQFRNLDAFVKEFDRHYTGGKTYRSEFYRKFQYYDDYNHVDAGKYHEQYRSNLQEWCDLNPDAGAPSIAMAGYEIYLAWYARGNGFSDTVTKSGWEKFYSHINRAKEILENAPEASKQDPHYYSLLITIHLASGSSIKDVQSVFEAGQNVDPTYINLYLGMTNYLQPKWYGSNFDDWVKWLDESLKHSSLSDEEKLVIYGTVVRSNVRGVYRRLQVSPTEFFKVMGIDEDLFLKGLSTCCKHYKDSTDWPTAYLYHANKVNSKPSIQEAIQMMNRKFSAEVSGGEKEFFILLESIEERFPELAPLMEE